MTWDTDLDDFQKDAAGHLGSHARLLAGPGTGKSLVLRRRVIKLISEDGVSPDKILALVFTRVNAFDLRRSISDDLAALDIEGVPVVRTLHSFALEQMLKNSGLITALPNPIRIADDYEENEFIYGDLFRRLELSSRLAVKNKFTELASDWQSLRADRIDYLEPDPPFLGAWEEHRNTYGYILRLELIWQLKQAIEENPDFALDVPEHLLVDEYQDFNRCDLDVIARLVERGAELFVAGDDDQSIYGFRLAHPAGIRRFLGEYSPSEPFELETCWRCDKEIIKLAQFVANMDPDRLEKPLEPRVGAGDGEVVLLRFGRETSEARGVASICRYLVDAEDYAPDDILILLRSDHNSVYSKGLVEALDAVGLDTSVKADPKSPLDALGGRYLLSLMRLHVSQADDLAWRTLLEKVRKRNQVGPKRIAELYQYAAENGLRFYQVINQLAESPELLGCGAIIQREVEAIRELLDTLTPEDEFENEVVDASEAQERILTEIGGLAEVLILDEEEKSSVVEYIQSFADQAEIADYASLLSALAKPENTFEQEVEDGVVNVLTMHRAKGLSAKAVIIVAAEQELIPGRSTGTDVGDQRRLLYVSLTRAKHRLYITYCNRREGGQRQTGSNRGNPRRHLTSFLRGLPRHVLRRENGDSFAQELTAGLSADS